MKTEGTLLYLTLTPVHYTNFVHWIVWGDLGSYPQYLVYGIVGWWGREGGS